MSDAWRLFIETENGGHLKEFFLKLNRKIGTSDRKSEGVLLLNTRKGYWIYKIFEKEEADAVLPVKVYSDRYAQKVSDLSGLEGKMIYLADDTLINGYSLLETYELLAEKVDEEQICPIVYAMSDGIDIRQKRESATGRGKNFWNKLKYYLLMSEDELGELSLKETQLIHKEGIPNMIDLPFLKDIRQNTETLNFQVCLTSDQFAALQKKREGWEFHLNSWKMENEVVLQGFIIQMKNEQLLENTTEFVCDYVVDGTYLWDENENIRTVFTPFAILKSMNEAFLLKLWDALFDGEEKGIAPEQRQDRNGWIKRYRECVYALSMMVAERFCKEVAGEIGIRLGYDYKILKDHFPDSMIDRMRKLEKTMKDEGDQFCKRLQKIYGERNECTYRGKEFFPDVKKRYDEEAAYKAVHSIILKNKDELKKQSGTLSLDQKLASILEIGQMERYLENCFEFDTKQEKRYALVREIVTILRSSVCNNKLEVIPDEHCLIRGFRCGENSDLLLPFFDMYFYWAVILLVSKCKMDGAAGCYDDFVMKLRRQYEQLRLLDSDGEKENFNLNSHYYKRLLEGKRYLYNKFYFLQPYLCEQLKGQKEFYMKKMEEFIEGYCW